MSHATPKRSSFLADPWSRRTMTVDLACDGTKEILKTFARCLAVLPNLHTLEVVSMAVHYSQYLHTALRGVKLPQIRTLILPSRAHHLLRHCPNVDDLTCTPFSPDEKFVESLAKGRQKLRRFAVLFPTNATIWTREKYTWHTKRMIDKSLFRTGSYLP